MNACRYDSSHYSTFPEFLFQIELAFSLVFDAIDMAEVEVHYGQDAVPMNLAVNIKKDQQMEIEELQKWLIEHRK